MTELTWLTQAALSLPTTVLVWSLLEYISHRWLMHRHAPWPCRRLFARHLISHGVIHHGRYFPTSLLPSETSTIAAEYIDMTVDPLRNVGMSAAFWLPLGVWISWPAALTFAAVGLLQGLAWSACHWQFHFHSGARWTNTRLFRFLRQRHERHHRDPRTCYGVLLAAMLPVDWCMGTLMSKRTDPATRAKIDAEKAEFDQWRDEPGDLTRRLP